MENNSTVWKEVEDLIFQIDWYYTPILTFVGLVCNSLSMYMFFFTKLCHSSSSIYLGTLAISDTGFLIAIFAAWISKMYETIVLERAGSCEFFHSLYICCGFLSVWLVVAFTVERYVVIKWPLRRRSWCTVSRAKNVVIVLIVLTIPQSIPVSLTRQVGEKTKKFRNSVCNLNLRIDAYLLNIYNTFDTFISFVVPMMLIIIFNTLIARNLYKPDAAQKSLIPMTNISDRASTESNVTNIENENNLIARNEAAQIKITKMLLFVSSVFVCLNTPWYIVRLVPHFYDVYELEESSLVWFLLREVGRLLYNTNYGINFILYCVRGQNFRRALIEIFWKRSNTIK